MRNPGWITRTKSASSRFDVETNVAVFRLCMVLLFGVFLAAAEWSGRWTLPTGLLLLFGLYALCAAAWLAVVRTPLLRIKNRIRTAIVLDQTLVALALWLGGELMAPVFWAPIAVALRCGLLGGTAYAKLASVYGAVLLAVAFSASPFWSGIPLVAAGIVIATIVIPWHAALLADQIAQSSKDMQRRAAAFELASKTDSLTGVLNRAGFLDALREQARKSARTGSGAALMLLDLDGFKAVNDVGGHAGGDAVLKAVTRCLRATLRAADKVARIGGDEFGIIVCDLAHGDDAEWLAAKLLQAIEAIRIDGRPELRVTASIGVHLLPDAPGDNLEALLETTDRLMYLAKRAGKNQFRSSFNQ